MENSKAFIEAGGNAEWQFIIFDYNEHQVEEAKNIAFDMGFKNFFTIGGYGRNETMWEAANPDDAIEGYTPMEQKGFAEGTRSSLFFKFIEFLDNQEKRFGVRPHFLVEQVRMKKENLK